MRRFLRLRVHFHGSCFVAVILITAIVVTQFPEAISFWRRLLYGLIASLLFFLAIGIRELVLVLLAWSRRIRVMSLTIFVFGAIPQEPPEVSRPVLERLLAVAGMVMNLSLAVGFYGAFVTTVVAGNEVAAGLTQWLAYIFVVITILHFLPGWPLDSGRLLVAYLWQTGRSYYRAVRISSWLGSTIGVVFLIGGFASIAVGRQWFIGLLMVLVGWALSRGAWLGRRHATFHEALEGISAGGIAAVDSMPVASRLNLKEVVRDYVLVSGRRYFPVVDDGRFQGVVTFRRIRSVPKKRWQSTTITQVMTPAKRSHVAYGGQSADSLLRQMEDLGLSEILVLKEDGTIGVVERDTVVRLARTRARIKV